MYVGVGVCALYLSHVVVFLSIVLKRVASVVLGTWHSHTEDYAMRNIYQLLIDRYTDTQIYTDMVAYVYTHI